MRQNEQSVSPMSNKGRNAYVIEHITSAMLNLLKGKNIDEISISELTDKARVGRASFYRNFNSKEDVLKAHLDRIFIGWINESKSKYNESLSEQLRTLILHFEKNYDFYKLLNDHGLIYLIKDAIINSMGLNPEAGKSEAYIKAFAAYATYGWIETWFQRGMKESADEIAEMFKTFGL